MNSIEKLRHKLLMSDEELQDSLCVIPMSMGYDVIISEQNDYIFCVPSGGKCIPVLLHANWMSERYPANHLGGDEPVMLYSINGTLANSNGKLGSKNRAGVQMILEVAESFEEKPFLLFTAGELAHNGMSSFIHDKVLEQYLDYIYLIIGTNMGGHNTAYIPKREMIREFPDHLEYKLTYVGYDPRVVNYSGDVTDLESVYKIYSVVVSNGTNRANSADEFMLFESYLSCIKRLKNFIELIDFKYTFDLDIQREEYHTDIYTEQPVCAVCERPELKADYIYNVGDFLCDSCKRNIVRDYGEVSVDTIYEAHVEFGMKQEASRQNNKINNQYRKNGNPVCPVCKSNKMVIKDQVKDNYVCHECYNKHMNGVGEYNGEFWIRVYNAESAYVFVKFGNVIIARIKSWLSPETGEPCYSERIIKTVPMSLNTDITFCQFCGEFYHKDSIKKTSTSDFPMKADYNWCQTCEKDFATIHDIYKSTDDLIPF